MTSRASTSCASAARRNRSFTLIELLVVIGIIALISAITMVSYRAIAKDAKLASAKNTVMAVLDNARGLAIKSNDIVMVVFRPRLDGNKQFVEVSYAKWSRQSEKCTVNYVSGAATQVVDRFVAIPGVANRQLPAGIQIAGPQFAASNDNMWFTLSYLPNIDTAGMGEVPGSILAVMFGPDGRTIMQNSKSDSQRFWFDFNDDKLQQLYGPTATPIDYGTPQTFTEAQFNGAMFEQRFENDEAFLSVVPYLSVFDDDQARELNDVTRWNLNLSGNAAYTNRPADYTAFITNNADRIHFNRYTGVALK